MVMKRRSTRGKSIAPTDDAFIKIMQASKLEDEKQNILGILRNFFKIKMRIPDWMNKSLMKSIEDLIFQIQEECEQKDLYEKTIEPEAIEDCQKINKNVLNYLDFPKIKIVSSEDLTQEDIFAILQDRTQ